MRKLFLFLWLLVPLGAGAYHYGPGQDRLRVDRAAEAADRADIAAREARSIAAREGDDAARAKWAEAEIAYGEAIEQLPAGNVERSRALRLEHAKAKMFVSKLPEAHRELVSLVEELASDSSTDPKQLADARSTLASAQYYRTWLMRLEGAPQDEWEREIEASRQNYKLVAEEAAAKGEEQLATVSRENLESSIRLERMELGELQGLPLPSQ